MVCFLLSYHDYSVKIIIVEITDAISIIEMVKYIVGCFGDTVIRIFEIFVDVEKIP